MDIDCEYFFCFWTKEEKIKVFKKWGEMKIKMPILLAQIETSI